MSDALLIALVKDALDCNETEWLYGDGEEPMGFIWWARLFNHDPQLIRDHAQPILTRKMCAKATQGRMF